jgi:hypothetical protein
MPTTKSDQALDYVPVTGPGVEALERRKEHNNKNPVDPVELRTKVDQIKQSVFDGLKALTEGALKRLPASLDQTAN